MRIIAIASLLAVVLAHSAHAQKSEILIGQSAGYTGRSSSSVKEFKEGADAYFELAKEVAERG